MSENPKKKPKLSDNLSHSMIERKRREKIKECVEELRLLVPSCRGSKKFQKLQILQNAIRYIKENDQKWNGIHCVDCPSMIKNQIGMDKVKDEQEGDLNSDLENLTPKVENQNSLGLTKNHMINLVKKGRSIVESLEIRLELRWSRVDQSQNGCGQTCN
ncbi:hypothetical protein HDV02_003850 [Globomyces sp. JEL0801]|nr:hypothetical protein HDV02_003850 [Globomyces sp. JEL0801]